MKSKNIIIAVLIITLVIISGGYIKETAHNRWVKKTIDQRYTTCYTLLVLNLLNMNIDGISETAINKYNAENTKYGYMLVADHSLSSYNSGNSDLNYLIMMLDQVSGYDAIFSVNMTKELYDKLKLVPNNRFGDEKIIKEAKEMLEQAIEK